MLLNIPDSIKHYCKWPQNIVVGVPMVIILNADVERAVPFYQHGYFNCTIVNSRVLSITSLYFLLEESCME